jgi:PKD repeat protein
MGTIMRTTTLSLLAVAAATSLAACTVKDVDTPALAGPSSLARTIVMTADRDSVLMGDPTPVQITLRAVVPSGQSENIRLRAQVFVDGIPQDYGVLDNKTPTTPATIRYYAPTPPTQAAAQVAQTISIGVTPDAAGDFRGEVTRTIDIRLIPPGVILPTNPNLAANFTITPSTPQVMTTVSFDAGSTTNNGAACMSSCTYNWDFGDGTTGTGQTTTHQYRRVGTFQVRLTVTDPRGAQATSVQTLTVAAGTPPTVVFRMSPTPAATNVTVFFSAEETRPAAGRQLVSFAWNFGDGRTGSGVTTSHAYSGIGTYQVSLVVTDDAGTSAQANQTLTVGSAGQPTASFTFLPSSPRVNQRVAFDATASTPGTGATIATYKWNYGDGREETGAAAIQSHTYAATGTYIVQLTVTDSNGRTATTTRSVTIAP